MIHSHQAFNNAFEAEVHKRPRRYHEPGVSQPYTVTPVHRASQLTRQRSAFTLARIWHGAHLRPVVMDASLAQRTPPLCSAFALW